MNVKLNKRERRALALLTHYARCEALAKYLGRTSADGKKVSTALFNLENLAHSVTLAYSNATNVRVHPRGRIPEDFDFGTHDLDQDAFIHRLREIVSDELFNIFGTYTIPGFELNLDPRGYALRISDRVVPVLEAQGLVFHRDMGGNGILSPNLENLIINPAVLAGAAVAPGL